MRRPASASSRRLTGSLVVLALGLAACGSLVQQYALVDQRIAYGHYAEADALVEHGRSVYGARNAVLYDLDRAMTLHLAGRYAESNTYLAHAEDRIDALYTTSLSREAGSFLTNDTTLPYEGEDFEKVMINIIAALNYVSLDRLDDALVEVRKVDQKLNVFNDRYERKNVYKEDAFARYLSGILYEARGELNDALVDYRRAYASYQEYGKQYQTPTPPSLPGDILRTAEALGASDILAEYRKLFPAVVWTPYRRLQQSAEVIFISLNGLSPIKEDFFITVPVPDGQGLYPFRLAVPHFVARPVDLAYAEVQVPDVSRVVASARTVRVEDVTAIARKNLDDRVARIMAKAVARATLKYAAAEAAEHAARKSHNEGVEAAAGLIMKVYGVMSEHADTRSWRTLPGEIQLTRIEVPPGSYGLAVNYYSRGGAVVVRRSLEPLQLRAGQKRFVCQRVVGSS